MRVPGKPERYIIVSFQMYLIPEQASVSPGPGQMVEPRPGVHDSSLGWALPYIFTSWCLSSCHFIKKRSIYLLFMCVCPCVFMCVCVCVCVYICVHAYECTCMSLCIYVCQCIYVDMCVAAHVCAPVCVYICVGAHVCPSVYVCLCMCAHMCR